MKSLTIQIGIFGRTNTGKSSLMNFITGQNTSIISEIAGTTTDLVYKQMELNPLGPVTFIDTAGLDDNSLLGGARTEKTQKALDACDVIILLCEDGVFGEYEKYIAGEAEKRKTPLIICAGKTDIKPLSGEFREKNQKYSSNFLSFSVKNDRNEFLNKLKAALTAVLPENFIEDYSSLKQIIKEKDVIVLVAPMDLGAPRGRLIMPQIQTIRSILDLNAEAIIVKNSEYESSLLNLKTAPALVITDSQVVKEIVSKTPDNIKVTTFSTLLSADKSDITEMVKGAAKLKNLRKGDKVLIAEACTHHASSDDIGRKKIPKWLNEYAGQEIEFDISSGQDFPNDLSKYKVIIHCGACTLNRKAMLSRMSKAADAGIAITNYGIAISLFQGVLERILQVFPQALEVYEQERTRQS